MAFQAPVGVTAQNVLSVTSELWPSMKATLGASWKVVPRLATEDVHQQGLPSEAKALRSPVSVPE
ncbi:MAG: hypothetical protein Q9219_004611 [cf. Caloplaca sp. 3 TL-2023]